VLVRALGLPAQVSLLLPLVRGQAQAADQRALPRPGLAQVQQRVLAQARAPQAPWPLVPAAGVAPRRVLAPRLALALLRLVRVRRVPGQVRVRRAHQCQA
jgi:hypothetical protein